MKVQMARINLVLKTSKVLSDGSSPILLMVAFNGKCTRSTSYSCTPKYWDKRGQCVKKNYPNWVMINHAINEMKNEAIERRNEYERQGEPYTAQMIISPRKSLSAVRNDLNGLISNYINEKGLKENTAYNWKYLFNLISEFDNKDVIWLRLYQSYKNTKGIGCIFLPIPHIK